MKRPPEWLAEFQSAFGAVLRAPLDSSSGTFRAVPSAYDVSARRSAKGAGVITAEERLAVYNRQYWFRLFGVMQSAYPLTARLTGHFRFNELASAFLVVHPPSSYDIDAAPRGFDEFLRSIVPESGLVLPRGSGTVERTALIQAAAIDAAFRRVFFAPPAIPFRPTAADAVRLLEGRLVPSDAVAIVEEDRPLLELRRSLAHFPGEAAVPLPPVLPSPGHWAIVRKPAGTGQLALEPLEARLLLLLRSSSVGRALALLESECPPEGRAALPERARTWLARSVELGFWSGLVGD